MQTVFMQRFENNDADRNLFLPRGSFLLDDCAYLENDSVVDNFVSQCFIFVLFCFLSNSFSTT